MSSQIESLGLIISILAGFIAVVAAIGLALSRVDDDGYPKWLSLACVDSVLITGFFCFILGLSKGIVDAFRDRSSGSFFLTCIFLISFSVASFGIWLMIKY